jgi:hypothetical protein
MDRSTGWRPGGDKLVAVEGRCPGLGQAFVTSVDATARAILEHATALTASDPSARGSARLDSPRDTSHWISISEFLSHFHESPKAVWARASGL